MNSWTSVCDFQEFNKKGRPSAFDFLEGIPWGERKYQQGSEEEIKSVLLPFE